MYCLSNFFEYSRILIWTSVLSCDTMLDDVYWERAVDVEELFELAEKPETRAQLRVLALALLRATRCEANKHLEDRDRAFIAAYMEDFNVKKAVRVAHVGYPHMKQLTKAFHVHGPPSEVRRAIDEEFMVREAESRLKAEYVRSYLLSVLELCPTDYLQVDDDGDWVCSPEKLADMPSAMRRLIETVEVKYSRGKRTLKIQFVSKSMALSIAARYTLVQKVEVTQVPPLNYDELYGKPSVVDPVERRILAAAEPESNHG